jgi:hypothetical protein
MLLDVIESTVVPAGNVRPAQYLRQSDINVVRRQIKEGASIGYRRGLCCNRLCGLCVPSRRYRKGKHLGEVPGASAGS